MSSDSIDKVLLSLNLKHEFRLHSADGDVGTISIICQYLLKKYHEVGLPFLPVQNLIPDSHKDNPSILDAPMSCETPVMIPTLVSQHVCDVECVHGHTLLANNGGNDPTKDFVDQKLVFDLYRCLRCRHCKACKNVVNTENTSLKAEREDKVLYDSVTLDIQNHRIECQLPLPDNYHTELKPNKFLAEKRLKSELMKLSRKVGPEPDQVKESFAKLIKRGYIRKFESLSAEDQEEVDSQLVHCYLPVVIAYKEAKGHEARPCLDGGSSLQETKSLNDLLPKGSSRFSMYKISQSWKVEMVDL